MILTTAQPPAYVQPYNDSPRNLSEASRRQPVSRTARNRDDLISTNVNRIYSSDISGGSIFTITLPTDPPPWLIDFANDVASLLSLQDNWDSYGARPISFTVLCNSLFIMLDIMDNDTPLPQAVPTVHGGIQLEWHTCGIDLEIEINPHDQISILFEDTLQNEVWEPEPNNPADLSRIKRELAKLTHRYNAK